VHKNAVRFLRFMSHPLFGQFTTARGSRVTRDPPKGRDSQRRVNSALGTNECNRLWVLKNSLYVPNSQNLGDRKCLPDPRKSILGHPDAILFSAILAKGLFQQPQAISLIDLRCRPAVTQKRGVKAPINRSLSIGSSRYHADYFRSVAEIPNSGGAWLFLDIRNHLD
jgi:hypothetical protein